MQLRVSRLSLRSSCSVIKLKAALKSKDWVPVKMSQLKQLPCVSGSDSSLGGALGSWRVWDTPSISDVTFAIISGVETC